MEFLTDFSIISAGGSLDLSLDNWCLLKIISRAQEGNVILLFRARHKVGEQMKTSINEEEIELFLNDDDDQIDGFQEKKWDYIS